jgi:hypothetical protein
MTKYQDIDDSWMSLAYFLDDKIWIYWWFMNEINKNSRLQNFKILIINSKRLVLTWYFTDN